MDGGSARPTTIGTSAFGHDVESVLRDLGPDDTELRNETGMSKSRLIPGDENVASEI